MIRLPLAAAGLLLGLTALHSPAAQARTLDFSYTLPSFAPSLYVTASGTLTTADTPTNGAYAITGITGSRSFVFGGQTTTQAITGLLSPDTAYLADNELFTQAPYLDSSGFTYTLAGGFGGDDFAGDVNVSYYDGSSFGGSAGYIEPIEGFLTGTFTLTPEAPGTAVPEPASLALLGVGLTLMAGLHRRGTGNLARAG